MSRLILLALLLALPLASAREGFAILPPDEGQCTYDESHSSEWQWYQDENGYSWYARDSYGYAEGCTYRDDLVDGKVTANGHDVVDVQVGSGSEWSQGWNSATSGSGHSYTFNNSSHSGSSWAYEGYADSSSTSGQGASVSNIIAGVSVFDGCRSEGASSTRGDGSYSDSSRDGQSSSGSYSSSSQEDRNVGGCGKTVSFESGVTSASAGWQSTCSSSSSAYEQSWSSTYDGRSWGNAWSGAQTADRCADGAFAQAGSERADVGSRDTCSSYTYADSWWSGNDTGSREMSGSDCERRTGVFGPTMLGIYLEDRQQDHTYCDDSACEEGSSSSHAIVVEHAYTGRVDIAYLP